MPEEKSAQWQLEEGTRLKLDFGKLAKAAAQSKGIIPVAVQNAATKEIILVAYTNKAALEKSIETGIATFWSTSRNELWIKGQTSGHYFELLEIRVNCEQNSLVYIVRPKGEGICHTRNKKGQARNCYYRRLNFKTGDLENLDP
ncbi:MAG TPA: phosphoribosyl-AMP cyclohydrolase [Dehalococcoidales bacterium]|nr:phosphoribosyl-AMP cyclohydrolase [Dehalococcoidales bacterium]